MSDSLDEGLFCFQPPVGGPWQTSSGTVNLSDLPGQMITASRSGQWNAWSDGGVGAALPMNVRQIASQGVQEIMESLNCQGLARIGIAFLVVQALHIEVFVCVLLHAKLDIRVLQRPLLRTRLPNNRTPAETCADGRCQCLPRTGLCAADGHTCRGKSSRCREMGLGGVPSAAAGPWGRRIVVQRTGRALVRYLGEGVADRVGLVWPPLALGVAHHLRVPSTDLKQKSPDGNVAEKTWAGVKAWVFRVLELLFSFLVLLLTDTFCHGS